MELVEGAIMNSVIQNMPFLQEGAVAPQLHGILRDRIITCELSPGQRVSETEFANVYKVSRQPVREAFIKLAEEGLVIVRPQRGTFVRRISVQSVQTARFIREAVESDIVRRVVERKTPSIIKLLKAEIKKQKDCARSGSPSEFMHLDHNFHRLLAEFSGTPDVADYLRVLSIPVNRVRNISARQFSPDRLVAQHAAIVDAIQKGDALASEYAMREHLREINLDLPRIVEANPDYFEGIEALS
jgi:DNA-binding GntR family transcriptional regulator